MCLQLFLVKSKGADNSLLSFAVKEKAGFYYSFIRSDS